MHEPVSFAAFIGIDWADRKHDVCLSVRDSDSPEFSVLDHRPIAIQKWAQGLRERFCGGPIAVCIELSPIVSALLEHDFFVIFPVNPSTLAEYRRAVMPSGAKDDPTDAQVALDLLLRHRDKLKPLQRERPDMRALRQLVEARRDLVQDRVRITNRLTYALKAHFPQVLQWFRDKETDVFIDFSAKWPNLQAAKRARPDTLVRFFHSHNVRYPSVVKRRLDAIKAETALTSDAAVIEPTQLVVQALLPQLRALNEAILAMDAAIAQRCDHLPDFRLFAELPGAGPVFAARLLAAFGEQRDRFDSAAAIQKYVGVAPVTERSGNNTGSIGAGRVQPSCGRPSSSGPGRPSLAPSGPAPSTNPTRLKAPPTTPLLAALAFKWIRILYRCWIDKTPYDESRYLTALQKRHAPPLKFAASVPS